MGPPLGLIAPDRVFPDPERIVDTVTEVQAAAGAARHLLAHLANFVDPHPPRYRPRSSPTGAKWEAAVDELGTTEAHELVELAGMAAAEHLRTAVLLTDALVECLGKAYDQVERQGQIP